MMISVLRLMRCGARLVAWGWLATLLTLTCGTATAQDLLGRSQVASEQVSATLLLHAPQGVAAGQPLWAGLQLRHAPDWHTYWKNPGDSGLPTELTWRLPPGVHAGEVIWPTPKKFPLGPLANHGYDGTVLLAVPLTVDPGFSAAQLTVGLSASWLACRKECIPEDAELSLTVPTRTPTALHGLVFEAARQAEPKATANKSIQASVEGQFIHIFWHQAPTAWHGKRLELFPETTAITEPGAPWEQGWKGGSWSARIPLSPMRTEAPARLAVVLAQPEGVAHGQPMPAGVRLDLAVEGRWPEVQALGSPGVSPALEAALKDNAQRTGAGEAVLPAAGSGWSMAVVYALLGALLGGMVLNLMPCVFPVLAIKVLAFAQHADDHRAHRRAGLAYTAGVVLSFVGLGALLLALRLGGEQLGWGFQLQSPAVVASLAALFTLLGLNLAGLFEFGSLLPSSVASVQIKNPTADAFLTGVLATAVASPCTAPFMGASLGLAIALPLAQALAVFAALGLGMALPYLLASWVPAVARALPRPGAWMVTFRQLMAFPMFATVVWLLWVLGQQSGIDGVATLLLLLVVMALGVWALGLQGRARLVLTGVALASGLWLLTQWGPAIVRLPDAAQAANGNGTTAHPQDSATASGWEAWSPQRQAELLTQGRPVLVDFTAAWCVTCQYNKRTTLADADVLADVAQKQVALLRADWTRRDPTVTAALAELGRNGVPVYALHAPSQPTVVLSEVLSVSEVRAALAAL